MVVLLGMDVSNNINNQNIQSNQDTQNNKPKFEFDKLKMYFGEPYIIETETCEIQINQPTIGDILDIGEKDFYSMLNIFISNTTSYRLQLWDMGVDWNKISDYELFCMLIKGLNKEITSLLFGDIDFQCFDLYNKKIEDDEVLTLYNKEQNIEISEETYRCISEYLRLMFNIYPKVEKAKGKATKEAIIDEDRMNLNLEIKKNKGYKSMLLPLVSSCINHPGFKYKLDELREIGIVQFMDSVQRLQVYESTVALNSGMYSGMCDLSKVDKNLFNFMRDIDDK
jgi:hypothetical protein